MKSNSDTNNIHKREDSTSDKYPNAALLEVILEALQLPPPKRYFFIPEKHMHTQYEVFPHCHPLLSYTTLSLLAPLSS
jgi:hypothetical protein